MNKLVLALTLVAAPSLASAQSLELGINGGVAALLTPDGNVGGTFEGTVAYRPNRWFQVAIHAGVHVVSFDSPGRDLPDIVTESVRAGKFGITARLEIPFGRLSLFVEPGFELLRWSRGLPQTPHELCCEEAETIPGPFLDSAILIGGGARIQIIERLAIQARLRGTLSASSSAWQRPSENLAMFDATIGLAVALTTHPKEEEEEEPAGVIVEDDDLSDFVEDESPPEDAEEPAAEEPEPEEDDPFGGEFDDEFD